MEYIWLIVILIVIASWVYWASLLEKREAQKLSMESTFDFYGRSSEKAMTLLAEFDDEGRQSLLKALVEDEKAAEASTSPRRYIRNLLMDCINTIYFNQYFLDLDSQTRGVIQEYFKDPVLKDGESVVVEFSDEQVRHKLLTASIRSGVLRKYSELQYRDVAEKDWFSYYRVFARPALKSEVDYLAQGAISELGKNEAMAKAAQSRYQRLKADLIRLRKELLRVSSGRLSKVPADFKRLPVEQEGQGKEAPSDPMGGLNAAIAALEPLPRCPYVFYNPRTGTRWHDCRKPWVKAREQAGVPDLQVKDLRRLYAINLAEAGANMHDIQQVLGHASVQTTERYYAQFSPEHSARKILRVLQGRAFGMEVKRKRA